MRDEQEQAIIDNDFYLIFNAHYRPVPYKLPPRKYASKWVKVLDTNEEIFTEEIYEPEDIIMIADRSVVVLQSSENNNKTNGN